MSSDPQVWSSNEFGLFKHMYERLKPLVPRQELHDLISRLRDDVVATGVDPDRARKALTISINACRVCDLVEPDPDPGHYNLVDPDLLVVLDTPLRPGDQARGLIQALKGAKLTSDRVGVTSVAKCQPTTSPLPDEVANTCTSRYLYEQISILRPKLIMPIGAVATTSLLTDTKIKITQIAGSMIWLGPWCILPNVSYSWAVRSSNRTQRFEQIFTQAAAFLDTESLKDDA